MSRKQNPPGPISKLMCQPLNKDTKTLQELLAESSNGGLPYSRPFSANPNFSTTTATTGQLNNVFWNAITRKLDLNPSDEFDLVNMLNIRFARNTARKMTGNIKLPFLLAEAKENIVYSGIGNSLRQKNPTILLNDSSGNILATFSRDFVEKYGELVVEGTVLAVANCGLSCIGDSREVFLTIPTSSLVCIATKVEINDIENPFEIVYDNGIYIMQKDVIDKEDVFNQYYRLNEQVE